MDVFEKTSGESKHYNNAARTLATRQGSEGFCKKDRKYKTLFNLYLISASSYAYKSFVPT